MNLSLQTCRLLVLALPVLLLLQGCNATKHVGEGEYLIKGNPKFDDAGSIDSYALESSIKTTPNRKIILPKIYLHAWAAGKTIAEDTSWLKRVYTKIDKDTSTLDAGVDFLMNTFGEPPALVDPAQLDKDAQNLESTYFANGFFNTQIRWEVHPRRINPKKAKVEFIVDEGPAYRFRRIYRKSRDKDLLKVEILSREQSKLQRGARYNEDVLVAERERLTKVMRNNGYYDFSVNSVRYVVDTNVTQNMIKKDRRLLENLRGKINPDEDSTRFVNLYIYLPDSATKYIVDEIDVQVIQNTSDTARLMLLKAKNLSPEEREYFNIPTRKFALNQDVHFRVTPRVLEILNLNTIANQLKVKVGQLYDLEKSIATQRRLREIGLFERAVMRYERVDTGSNHLRLIVELRLMKRFNFELGLEAFQNEDVRLGNNLPGIGLRLSTNKRNAFKRAERLNLGLQGSVQFYRPNENAPLQLYYNYGVTSDIVFPRLLMVGRLAKRLFKIYSPTTTVSGEFRVEEPVEFTRRTFGLGLTYTWNHQYALNDRNKPLWTSTVTALKVNTVSANLTPAFQNELDELTGNDPALLVLTAQDFNSRFNSSTGYALKVSERWNYAEARKPDQFGYALSGNIGLGGNLPFLVDAIGEWTSTGDQSLEDHAIAGTQNYGQFVSLGLEGKIVLPIYRQRLLARVRLGTQFAYGANSIVPFEYRYFIGGTNSVRGWQSRTLGPGTYDGDFSGVITFGGHYMFESNLEYRFPLFDPVEGALFVDAGNVWFNPGAELGEPNAKLSRETLQLGVSGGLGLRLDFTFVIIRLDFAQQMYSPAEQSWLVNQRDKYFGEYWQVNLAIGYPF